MLLSAGGQLVLNDFDVSCFSTDEPARRMPVGTDAYRSPRLDSADAPLYEEQDDWVALCISFADLFLGRLEDDKLHMLQAVADAAHAPHNMRMVTRQQLAQLARSGSRVT